MSEIRELLTTILFDSTPEEKAKLFRAMFRIAALVFVVWSIGLMRPFGLGGFAKADDVEVKRNEAIEVAVGPIRTQLSMITTQLTIQDQVLKQIRIDQLATKLRDLHNIECTTKDHNGLDRIATEIEATQRQYRDLTGERYPFEACKP